jgi:hypothetical protein
MQGHAGGVHPLRRQGRQHPFVKMQRSCGCSHRARGARKHGLVALGVFCGVRVIGCARRAFNVGGEWHHAVLFHQCVRLVAQLQVKQLAVFIGPAPEQHRIKTTLAGASSEVHLAPQQRLFAHLHVRHHLVTGQHALDQQLQLAT